MRDFFSNDHRGLLGPSALFSAGMYCLDAHILGSDPDMQNFLAGKFDKSRYYPTTHHDPEFTGIGDMEDVRNNFGNTMGDVASRSFNSKVQIAFTSILSDMGKMRAMHLGVAKKFLPEAFMRNQGPEKIKGSGGITDVEHYLNVPRFIYEAAHKNV